MPLNPNSKSKHHVSALSKAIRTQRHSTATNRDANKTCLDARAAATATEFSAADLGLQAAKRAPAKSTARTVLAGESVINVNRRIRNASVPIGVAVDDVAGVGEELSVAGFDTSRAVRHLMPRRPAWSFEVSSGRLHHREVQGFKQWLAEVQRLIEERGGYPPAFEQNLQVWRQLWRVLERCDVAVVVIDVRHPLLHLPPALVYHVTRTLRKPLVLVLNKLDTVAPGDAARWAECLRQAIPGIAGIVGYSKEALPSDSFGPLQVGRSALIETCHKALEEAKSGAAAGTVKPEAEAEGVPADAGRVMLGLVGHPNVGKSSLINSLMGSKVVSVKATPGHTKTLQTMVLDERTCLCDSPGIVFPRLDVPREAQIVGMLIPLAQVREPFSAIRWVMERARLPLHELLHLKPLTVQQALDLQEAGTEVLRLEGCACEEQSPAPWSPMLLCTLYATQRGLIKGGRADCLRAGMEVLERVLDGRVPYSVPPPPAEEWATAQRGTPCGEESAPSGSDSDWQVDDGEYESEPEEEASTEGVGLFEVFGIKPKEPGSGSINSRKKQAKRNQRETAEAA